MNHAYVIRTAVDGLWRHRLRSLSTALGVMIGVGALVSVVSLGDGATTMVAQAFKAIGSESIVVLPGSTSRGGAYGGFGTLPTLMWSDLEAIRREVPSVRVAAATLRTNAQVVSGRNNWSTSVVGTSPEYLDIRAWPIERGTSFHAIDVERHARVVVLGATVATKLFPAGASAIDRTVRINNVSFRVIGLLAAKGQSPAGEDYDDVLLMPQTTFASKVHGGLHPHIPGVIHVAAAPGYGAARAVVDVQGLLRERHRLAPDREDDFSIRNLSAIAAAQRRGTEVITSLLATIAVISLIVGGIGVMNVMLVSVAERTREIGLRVALGATRRHVLMQFLTEALVLSVAGGAVGVAGGAAVALQMAERFGWPVLIRIETVLQAVAFSALFGIVFGLYPAHRAAQLRPIEALRYE